jgi:hypothetical protein
VIRLLETNGDLIARRAGCPIRHIRPRQEQGPRRRSFPL